MTKTEALEAKISHKPVYFGDDMVCISELNCVLQSEPWKATVCGIESSKLVEVPVEWLSNEPMQLW